MATAKKLETLTPEQIDAQETFAAISFDVGLKTGPTNRETVIPAFKELYKTFLNRAEPEYFIFVESPMQAQLVIGHLLKDKKDSHKKVTLENNDEFVKNTVNSYKGKLELINTHSFGFGSFESYWIYFYKYFQDVCSIQFNEKDGLGLSLFETLAKNSGWHYLFEDTVVVCDRPSVIRMDNAVLHSDDSPSCEFSDGFKVYNIRGHLVPENIVMNPESITIKDINNESNNETKRIMIERFGVMNYLNQTKSKVIDKDQLSLEGSTPRVLIEDGDGNRWLCCSDGSTGRMYFLPASQTAKTCKEAHEEMSGFSEDDIIGEC